MRESSYHRDCCSFYATRGNLDESEKNFIYLRLMEGERSKIFPVHLYLTNCWKYFL